MAQKMYGTESSIKPSKMSLKSYQNSLVHKHKNFTQNNNEEIFFTKQKNQIDSSMQSWDKSLINQFGVDNISSVCTYNEDQFSKIDEFFPDPQVSARSKKQFTRKNSTFRKQKEGTCLNFTQKNIKNFLLSALASLSSLKQFVNQTRDIMRIENKRNDHFLEMLAKKCLHFQSQPKNQLPLETFRSTCQSLTQINKDLLKKNTQLQCTIHTLKKDRCQTIHLKQLQLKSTINELSKVKNKNHILNILCQKQKEENDLLHEQIFNMKQQQKGIELEIESRVQNILNQFSKSSVFFQQTMKNSLLNPDQQQQRWPMKKSINRHSWDQLCKKKHEKKYRKIHTEVSDDEKKEQLSQKFVQSTKSTIYSPDYSLSLGPTSNIKYVHSGREGKQVFDTRLYEKSFRNSTLEAVDNRLKKMKTQITSDLQKLKKKYE